MELSKYVKGKRKEYNLTQVELSDKSGVGLRFIRDLEQGKQNLRFDKVNQVLAMFGAQFGVIDSVKTQQKIGDRYGVQTNLAKSIYHLFIFEPWLV